MSETSLERALGRVEGSLEALAKTLERLAEDAEVSQRVLDARLDALERRVGMMEISLVSLQTDMAAVAPAIDGMAGIRRGAKIAAGVGAVAFAVAGWFGDRIATFISSHIRW